jgi:hypothetical protein
MPYTLNGQPLQRATLNVPRHGVWEGSEVAVAGELDLAEGSAVEIVVGDTTFKGFVVTGGTFAGASESTYTVAGGAAGWAAAVPSKGYNVPAGVSLATVAAQLAVAAGELLDLGGVGGTLGDHWTRPAGPASVALSALFPLEAGGWRVDPDGYARPGVRPPAPVPASVQLAVEDYQAGRRWARIGLPGDEVSALLPGAIVTAPNLSTPIVVGETTIKASADAVVVEVLGEGGLVELFVGLVEAITARSRIFNTLWTYKVADADNGAPNLKAMASAPGLPPILSCAKVPGVAGVTLTLSPGALVLVAFRDGSPAQPVIVGYLPPPSSGSGPGTPQSISATAAVSILLGGNTPVADAVQTNLALGILAAGINGLGGHVASTYNVGMVKLKGG